MGDLEKIVECDCGWTYRGSEDEIVAAVAVHARDVHGLELTREQILAAAKPVDDPRGGAA